VVLFFRRRSSLPRIYIGVLLASLAWRFVDDAMALQIPVAAAKLTTRDGGELAGGFVLTLIWVAYFLRSDRVRATFVERLRQTAPAAAGLCVPEPEAAPAA
jgi:Protein of unknown function (DUF2569)